MRKRLVSILMCGLILLGLCGCGKNEVNGVEKENNQLKEEYGSVEEEKIDILVAKFNTLVVDNSKLNPASEDYLTLSNGEYWYGLIDGIYLVIVP